MAEFNIQSDSVDVKRIMEQIRQRIQGKRGRDYTEQQIRELATVKLERFLDPQQVRSDLVEHYRQLDSNQQDGAPPALPAIDFDEDAIYASSRRRMGKLIRLSRKLLSPILKLFFNPAPIVSALARHAEIIQRQAEIIQRQDKQLAARAALDALNYEVLNNLVVELTRLSIDLKNDKMHVESVAGRLDFDERRARALESVVQSRLPQPIKGAEVQDGDNASSSGSGWRRRRRRSGAVTSTDPKVDDV